VVYLTERVLQTLAEQPRLLHAQFVFLNPSTAKPWQDIQGAGERARKAAGLSGVWVHDLRRSFVTLARRSGLPESVVARFSATGPRRSSSATTSSRSRTSRLPSRC
jgi:integrase